MGLQLTGGAGVSTSYHFCGLFVIGVTGGIATGKSSLVSLLRAKGSGVVDADRLGHEVYNVGTPAYKKILEVFGNELASSSDEGKIDRKVLGQVVFGDDAKRRRLESIVWPDAKLLAENALKKMAETIPSGVAVLEAALLVEAGWTDLVDELWVVHVDPRIAIKRLMKRNGLSLSDAQQRISALAASDKQRIAKANVLIDNSGTMGQLEAKVDELWKKLVEREVVRQPTQ